MCVCVQAPVNHSGNPVSRGSSLRCPIRECCVGILFGLYIRLTLQNKVNIFLPVIACLLLCVGGVTAVASPRDVKGLEPICLLRCGCIFGLLRRNQATELIQIGPQMISLRV